METPPNCSSCQTPMMLREKEGQKFWGCPNWKECGGKTVPVGGYKKKSGNEGFQKVAKPVKDFEQGETILEAQRKTYAKLLDIERGIESLYDLVKDIEMKR